MRKPLRSVHALIVFLVLSASGLAHGGDGKLHHDRDYHFSFSYPRSWEVKSSDNRGARQILIRPAEEHSASSVVRCMISVGKVPQKKEYTQAELDQFVMQKPMAGEDWKQFFAPAGIEAQRILETKTARLFGIAAHYAVMEIRQSGEGIVLHMKEFVYLTNTPHLSWNIACLAGAASRAGADERFAGEAMTFRTIVDSLKLDPGRIQ